MTVAFIHRRFWGGLALALLALMAYGNALTGPWLFDDFANVRDNPLIRTLDPGAIVTSGHPRPVLMLTLAVNYAWGGLATPGYHVTNLLIHLAAAGVLWRLVERWLRSPRLLGDDPAAARLAWLSAAVWLVHPLQTESVSYLVQRAESLMGFCYLTALYALVRSQLAPRPWPWWLVAIACTWLGYGCKEVAITLPVVAALLDRMLFSDSWSTVLRRRGAVYLAQFAVLATYAPTTVPLLAGAATSAGLGQLGHSPLEHLYSQPTALLLYLRLTIWPWPQCFDWNVPPVTQFSAAAIHGTLIVALLIASLVAGHLQRVAALPWLLFFVLLAPTSSMVPVLDIAVEHRMYLPLAGFAVGAVLGGYRGLCRWCAPAHVRGYGTLLACGVLLVLTTSTIRRNRVYQSELALWQSVVQVRPDNPRALNNLALAELAAGQTSDAEQHARRAFELSAPRDRTTMQYNLARTLTAAAKFDEALGHYQAVIRAEPEVAESYRQLSEVQLALGQFAAAHESLTEAARREPQWANVQLALGQLALERHEPSAALVALERANHRQPHSITILAALAEAYAQANASSQLNDCLQQLATLTKNDDRSRLAAVRCAAQRGRLTTAEIEELQQLNARYPQDAELWYLTARIASQQHNEPMLDAALRRLDHLAPHRRTYQSQLAAELAARHGSQAPPAVAAARLAARWSRHTP